MYARSKHLHVMRNPCTPVLFLYSIASRFVLLLAQLSVPWSYQQWVGSHLLTAQKPPSFQDALGTHQSATVIQ